MEKLGAGEPQQIGAYRLLARLGAGGMGRVYLARSDRGRTVAVKLVREELAAQEEFRARFRQEVLAARRVGGLWTAPVLDADTEAAVPWVATGYVAGPSLQTVVGHDHGALPERSVRILAAGLAHALKDIHAAGLIHRDLKPSNVLVTIDGPRVIDFGIARALETVTDGGLTRTGALVGSPGFMAPEQVRGDRVTPACDVFCLGSVLSYAATGALPFGAANSGVHAMMFRIAQEDPDLDGVPEGLADLVRHCLRKDPAARPGLDEILERIGAEDTVVEGRSRDPWLPSALVAQLGRHAVRLLDTENPAERPAPAPAPPTRQAAAPAQEPAPGSAPAALDLSKSSAAPAPTPAPAPEVAPEHAATPPPPGGPASTDHLPTLIAGADQTPPPAAPPAAHPAYGHPQQHPSPTGPPAYGHPQGGWGAPGSYGPTPPYGPGMPTTPYGPAGVPEPEPPRRSGRSTAALIVVALVVALGAGGSVYALMQGGPAKGTDDAKASSAASKSPSSPDSSPSSPSTPSSSPSDSPSPQASQGGGAIPEGFLGTWDASIDNATGHNTRRLTIQQGAVGDTVLSLVADGPSGSSTYHCVFRAELTAAPGAGGPLVIGPSEVTGGAPISSCSPGAASEITLQSDGRLRRVNTGSGESLTYTKSG
ncbi:serine/threonine protein kinase [Streptomyces sp. RLB3-17]|uniref:serine/threonine-protein kinase n=1 Tax=unclassified Streptomyces TaxID=2593676 RepID=UPI001162CE8E|nr:MULTISPECIES: serine/threonine-protein kinase [unclassified Streptomyces]QDN59064.1 serine/threonine protein kinase [Streptomyces sp. S1D4-20]QDN69139.1 serine/threonine protein kinase [Streptomyces sp. S1D4-14]QDO41538.1 serine/threonine protein kinase [Streptomyces sp. RLB3-17]QDO51555.1 serine/threonine protein kinase [Streptomyces sp. RLB3-5]QDO61795.1 serine/threonine protein kinase [Streptomyces sp. RLB1-8]